MVIHPRLKVSGGKVVVAPEARLAEAVGLAKAISLDIIDARVVNVARPRPATLFGQGAVDDLGRIIVGKKELPPVDVVVVDTALTPVQQRNLEKEWDSKVIDRTGLILEIFGERARTREGRLQVELAALTYQRSRLVRSWTHLERQRGGFGFMGGPGESQIETDRRLISDRIVKLKRELEAVKRTRELHRQARRRVPYPIVALVGYTNAGKSTLFNQLTRAEVLVQDQLFATLDPTMRALELPSGRTVILSDTVGFISDLPHELVNAFHATLEEVEEADLLLHVRDASHPLTEEQRHDVIAVLKELGLESKLETNLVEVLNKADLMDAESVEIARNRAARAEVPHVVVSATEGEGSAELLEAVEDKLFGGMKPVTIDLAHADGKTLAWLYQHGGAGTGRFGNGYPPESPTRRQEHRPVPAHVGGIGASSAHLGRGGGGPGCNTQGLPQTPSTSRIHPSTSRRVPPMATARSQRKWRDKHRFVKRQLNVTARKQIHDDLDDIAARFGLAGKAEAVTFCAFVTKALMQKADFSADALRVLDLIEQSYARDRDMYAPGPLRRRVP